MTDAPRPCVLLVDDDALLLNGLVRLLRPTRRSVLTALTAPRGQRLGLRRANDQRLDYFVQEISVGTLIAFAPAP